MPAWEAEIYPAIRAEAKAAGATIYFADESGIRSDYHTGTTWAPVGETPVVEVTGRRFSLNMISAVSPQGEFRFMLHDGTVERRSFPGIPQAPADRGHQAGVSDCRWSSDSQGEADQDFRRGPERQAQVVLPAALLAATEPGRTGLGACQTQGCPATGAIQGRNEAAGPRRLAPNPEIARVGEIVLSPTRVSICRYVTLFMQTLVARIDIYHNGKLVRHGNKSPLILNLVRGFNELGDHHFKMVAHDASFNKASAELSIRVNDGSNLIGLHIASPQLFYASDYVFQVVVKSSNSIATGTVRLNSYPPLDLRSSGRDLEREVALKPGWNSLVVEVRDINGGAMAREFNVYYASFVGLALNDERLVALRPLVEDIYFSYGLSEDAPAISRTRALRDWVARHVVHPDTRFHPNGSTANTSVLAKGNSWALVNAVLNETKVSADQEFWADYKYDGYAMLDTLLGTLNRQSGYRSDDGLMEQVVRGHYRIRDIGSFRYAYCTYQAAVLQVLWAAAGFQSMMLSSNGHDPAVVFIPKIGWVYSDPTFNEELRVFGDTKPLTILEVLESIQRDDRKSIFPFKGIDENRSGPLWDNEQYIASDVTYLKAVPSGFSYLRVLLNSSILGGSSNREVVTIRGSRDPWPGPIVLADEAFRSP